MAKPLNEFGGWLRFFQITNIIGVVLLGISIFMSTLAIADFFIEQNYKEVIELTVIALDIIITFILTLKILWVLKIRDKCIPVTIRRCLLWILIFSIIFLGVEISVVYWINGWKLLNEDYQSFRGSIQTVVFCLIWISYFKKSKRVSLYYNSGNVAIDLAASQE